MKAPRRYLIIAEVQVEDVEDHLVYDAVGDRLRLLAAEAIRGIGELKAGRIKCGRVSRCTAVYLPKLLGDK